MTEVVQHYSITNHATDGRWSVACTCGWITLAKFATRPLALAAHGMHKQEATA